MRLIANKICRRRYKIQTRFRKWLFGRKKGDRHGKGKG